MFRDEKSNCCFRAPRDDIRDVSKELGRTELLCGGGQSCEYGSQPRPEEIKVYSPLFP